MSVNFCNYVKIYSWLLRIVFWLDIDIWENETLSCFLKSSITSINVSTFLQQ